MPTKQTPAAPSPIVAAEADLAQLTKRRDALDARRAAAVAASLAAVAARRVLLVDHDDPPAADLARADRACRDAEAAATAAGDALLEIGLRIGGAEDRLARLRAAEDRGRQAAALDAVAAKVDDAAERIARAAREIAAARADLAVAITPDVAALYAPPSRDHYGVPTALVTRGYGFEGRSFDVVLSPEAVASRIAGHVLAPVLPSLGIADEAEAHALHVASAITRTLVPVDGAEGAAALLAAPLRTRAEALRNGEVVDDLQPYTPAPHAPAAAAFAPEDRERIPPGFTGERVAPGVVRFRPVVGEEAA